ncbi:hypothetical protein Tco_0908593 [Tanacetum coccineum]|uniref:Uncharacterized protein n=1 Tax=Tanacetum coccineum TaxID=301880 RepID=A0ABQ5CQW9_9ASTR
MAAISLSGLSAYSPEGDMILANSTSIDKVLYFLWHEALNLYAFIFDVACTPKISQLLHEIGESGSIIVTEVEMIIGEAYLQYKRFTGLPGKAAFCCNLTISPSTSNNSSHAATLDFLPEKEQRSLSLKQSIPSPSPSPSPSPAAENESSYSSALTSDEFVVLESSACGMVLLHEIGESGSIIVTEVEMIIGEAYLQYKRFTGLPGKPLRSYLAILWENLNSLSFAEKFHYRKIVANCHIYAIQTLLKKKPKQYNPEMSSEAKKQKGERWHNHSNMYLIADFLRKNRVMCLSRNVETRGESSSAGHNRLTSTERDLENALMESRSFHDGFYGSLFQQSRTVETRATTENTHADGNVNVESRPFNTVGQRVSSACEIASSINGKRRREF